MLKEELEKLKKRRKREEIVDKIYTAIMVILGIVAAIYVLVVILTDSGLA